MFGQNNWGLVSEIICNQEIWVTKSSERKEGLISLNSYYNYKALIL